MDGFDNATWQALGLILTMLGLGASAVLWSRRGAVSGLRGVAWSLLPLAAGLTGVLRLGWEITDSVVSWAARLVFSPMVWLGLVVAAVSLVLFVVTGFASRRRGPEAKPAARPAKQKKALPSDRSTPPATAQGAGGAGTAGDDMDDIEAILRKHGIS
jgi:hypothetical protein